MPNLNPESPSALSPLIRRVVADNPGLMTGPGTNTYLVGIDEVAVIDPGPDLPLHVDAIVGASMLRAREVGPAHPHPPRPLAGRGPDSRTHRRTHRRVLAFPKSDEVMLELDIVLADGDTIDGTEFRLEALHTPGHAPNHLCFWLDEERALFTGDHVLNGTTTVVNPQRGGDMVQYLDSLERLRKLRRVARICPGHGDVIEDPTAVLDEYVAHRKMRERQILKLLKTKPATIPRIVTTLYRETPEGLPDGLVEMARRQVHAHLLKLKAEGKVSGSGLKASWTAS